MYDKYYSGYTERNRTIMTEYINTYNELCEKVKRWSAAYYEQDAPVVTDEEYDRAMHEIRDLEAAHPELVTSDSQRR